VITGMILILAALLANATGLAAHGKLWAAKVEAYLDDQIR